VIRIAINGVALLVIISAATNTIICHISAREGKSGCHAWLAGALTTVNFIPEPPLPFTDDDALPPPVPVLAVPVRRARAAVRLRAIPNAYALPWRGWGHEHGWHQPAQVKRGALACTAAVT
jgi:hypothetical protein